MSPEVRALNQMRHYVREDTALCAWRGHNTRALQTSANAFCACNGNGKGMVKVSKL
jgi:hypothetical protein